MVLPADGGITTLAAPMDARLAIRIENVEMEEGKLLKDGMRKRIILKEKAFLHGR
jgi:hypothetical protein